MEIEELMNRAEESAEEVIVAEKKEFYLNQVD